MTTEEMIALWEEHCSYEFDTRDVDATMATMVAEPYVNHIPTLAGGVGHDALKRFYRYHFIGGNPDDTKLTLVSRTVGASGRSTIGISTAALAGRRPSSLGSRRTSGVHGGGWAKRSRRACAVNRCNSTAGSALSTATTGTRCGSKVRSDTALIGSEGWAVSADGGTGALK